MYLRIAADFFSMSGYFILFYSCYSQIRAQLNDT